MNSLDANVVLRFLLNDVTSQTKKSKAVISSGYCYVTDVIIVEVIFVLERTIGLQRSDVARLVEKFLGLPNMVYNNYFLDRVIDLYRSKPILSVVDCYAAVEAEAYKNKLVTFDKALAKYGGPHVKEL